MDCSTKSLRTMPGSTLPRQVYPIRSGHKALKSFLKPFVDIRSERDMSASGYIHSHNFLGAGHDENAKRTLWVVGLTVVMMVGEIAAGYITGSMALLADGFHMATHAGALGIAAAAYAFARKHSENSAYSFGTGKVGDLGGFASALILGLISLSIGIESILRLFEPNQVQFGTATLIAVIGLIVNIVSALLLAGGGHGHGHGHSHGEDNNLRSAYVHVLADAVTSVLAIVALLAGKYLGWVWLDPVMGIVGAVVIARWAWSLMRDTASSRPASRSPVSPSSQVPVPLGTPIRWGRPPTPQRTATEKTG